MLSSVFIVSGASKLCYYGNQSVCQCLLHEAPNFGHEASIIIWQYAVHHRLFSDPKMHHLD